MSKIKFYLTVKMNFTSNQRYCHGVFAVIFIVGKNCQSHNMVEILKISSILLQKKLSFTAVNFRKPLMFLSLMCRFCFFLQKSINLQSHQAGVGGFPKYILYCGILQKLQKIFISYLGIC